MTAAGRVQGVVTRTGACFNCHALVLTTGTYLRGPHRYRRFGL